MCYHTVVARNRMWQGDFRSFDVKIYELSDRIRLLREADLILIHKQIYKKMLEKIFLKNFKKDIDKQKK